MRPPREQHNGGGRVKVWQLQVEQIAAPGRGGACVPVQGDIPWRQQRGMQRGAACIGLPVLHYVKLAWKPDGLGRRLFQHQDAIVAVGGA